VRLGNPSASAEFGIGGEVESIGAEEDEVEAGFTIGSNGPRFVCGRGFRGSGVS
jgi:hypothetical protein